MECGCSTPEHTAVPLKPEQEKGGRGGFKQNIFAKNILIQEKSSPLPLAGKPSLIKTTPEYFMLISIRQRRRNLEPSLAASFT